MEKAAQTVSEYKLAAKGGLKNSRRASVQQGDGPSDQGHHG